MTKVELALILQIIDTHTKCFSPNYYPECMAMKQIDDVDSLKEDIIKKYEEVMKMIHTHMPPSKVKIRHIH